MENDSSNITVSICSITYNHAPFIRECLDGFLMQKTNFNYEIIINDDCSTDGTTEILREYEEKYPHLIKVVYHEQNQYSQGVREIFQKFVFPLVKGKYVALCEGDDYWTDPLKLQKQVDFMEGHPDFSLCFHAVNILSENECDKNIFSELKEREYFAREIFENWTIPTCSSFLKSECLSYIPHNINFQIGDNVIFLTCATRGKLFCHSNKMSTYRIHKNGWCKSTQDIYWILATHTEALKESFKNNFPNNFFEEKLLGLYSTVANEHKRNLLRTIYKGLSSCGIKFAFKLIQVLLCKPIIKKLSNKNSLE